MIERPILFRAEMVRALLAGRKTQTRRLIKATRGRPIEFLGGGPKGGPDWNDPTCWGYEHHNSGDWVLLKPEDGAKQYPCLYGAPGDQLWVREAWRAGKKYDALPGSGFIAEQVFYESDDAKERTDGRYRYARFMPRWASRLTLRITDVRAQRLQDISDEDALAEGVSGATPTDDRWPTQKFKSLWESINGADSWPSNPWVWAITFEKVSSGSAAARGAR